MERRRKRIKKRIAVTERDSVVNGHGLSERDDIDARNGRRMTQTFVVTDVLFVILMIVSGRRRSVRHPIFFLQSGTDFASRIDRLGRKNRFPVADCRAEKFDHQQKKPQPAEASQVSFSSDDFIDIRHLSRQVG